MNCMGMGSSNNWFSQILVWTVLLAVAAAAMWAWALSFAELALRENGKELHFLAPALLPDGWRDT